MAISTLCFICFFFGYTINMFYISVLYHRALTHKSILLGPKMLKWLGLTGVWFTGLDPKTWACMHRLHHTYSDTDKDPHSPARFGVLGVWISQYTSYMEIQKKLLAQDPELNLLVKDIPFNVSYTNRKNLSWLPYIIHGIIGFVLGSWLNGFAGAAYFLGMMSHPVQGWMVNALAHKYGKRNFSTPDQSTNNTLVGIFVFGEGYQNNHHHAPQNAKFSVKWYEIDFGYLMCLISEKIGILKINRNTTF